MQGEQAKMIMLASIMTGLLLSLLAGISCSGSDAGIRKERSKSLGDKPKRVQANAQASSTLPPEQIALEHLASKFRRQRGTFDDCPYKIHIGARTTLGEPELTPHAMCPGSPITLETLRKHKEKQIAANEHRNPYRSAHKYSSSSSDSSSDSRDGSAEKSNRRSRGGSLGSDPLSSEKKELEKREKKLERELDKEIEKEREKERKKEKKREKEERERERR